MGWIQVPSFGTFGTFELKPVRLFSDITRRDTATDEMALIMPQLPPAVTKAKTDSCPPGVESIIDFSDSTQRGMRPFYEALLRRNEMQRPVRIAYFGDSFIEGDILTADLRALLQGEYGGAGAGFSDMAPPFAGFRISLPLHASGWDVRNVLQKDSCERHRLGPTQRYAIPTDSAYTEARGCRHYAHLDTFHRATIYLSSPRPLQIRIRRNRNASETLVSQGTGQLETLVCQGAMGRISWKVEGDSLATCYGFALEDNQGVSLDNFSLRGSGGTSLAALPQQQWKAFAKARPYDLIILHFGLNVANGEVVKYDYYTHELTRVIGRLKQAYPQAGFLIVSVSDREDRIEGELRTLPGVKALVGYQMKMAADNHIAFWNLYKAMGGEGSIVKMAEEKPAGARKDYTHITRPGGSQLAKHLFKALQHGYETFRKENDEENP